MRLVKDGAVVADPFTRLPDDAAVPAAGALLVPGKRFLADAAVLAARAAPLGVIWPNNQPVDALAPHLERLALVALVFPSFRDGRAYSQARILRERHGYRGELRASGQVLRDQFNLLRRAGFDAYEISKDIDADAFVQTVARFSAFYQPTGADQSPVAQRRLARHRAAREAAPHATGDSGTRP